MFQKNSFRVILLVLVICLFNVGGCGSEEGTDTGTNNGTTQNGAAESLISISQLDIGDMVVDGTWEWGHRVGENYSGSGEQKPVVWILAAKDHYETEEGIGSVTLVAGELIGLHVFDDSTDRGHPRGNNTWRDSGEPDAENGLRKFLNQEFYGAISAPFREAILNTELPNATLAGETYITSDRVFALSQTELGGGAQDTHVIGERLPYFNIDDPAELAQRRIGVLDGNPVSYWTRSPSSEFGFTARFVHGENGWFYRHYTDNAEMGVRPALNVHSGVEVTERPNEKGIHEIRW